MPGSKPAKRAEDSHDREDQPPSKGAAEPTPEGSTRDVKDPAFVRSLLDQMCRIADHHNKKCKECNRNVVSIYNLDRHVATQHLGLKESEYSLISKELRRLRAELCETPNLDSAADAPSDLSMSE